MRKENFLALSILLNGKLLSDTSSILVGEYIGTGVNMILMLSTVVKWKRQYFSFEKNSLPIAIVTAWISG